MNQHTFTRHPSRGDAPADLGPRAAGVRTVLVTGGGDPIGRQVVSALVASGLIVRVLVDAPEAAVPIAALGADAQVGGLSDVEALEAALRGCEAVIHTAARLDVAGRHDDLYRDEVLGVAHLLAAARRAGVRRLVHIGAAVVVKDRGPIHDADETRPRRTPRRAPGITAQSLAEERVLGANSGELETVVVRPALIWGPGADRLLLEMDDWVGEARHRYSTCHVENVAAGALAALGYGGAGQVYFVADDDSVELGAFFRELRANLGDTPARGPSIARRAARVLARLLHPVRAAGVRFVLGDEFTVSDGRARAEIGYRPVVSRTEGLARLRA